MKKVRQHRICKIVWMAIALHFLNFSVNAPDAKNGFIAEDLSYNKIESIAEWLAEDVLQIEDAFTEKDDTTQNDFNFTKKTACFEFCQITLSRSSKNYFYCTAQNNSTISAYNRPSLGIPYLEVFSPPPEA